MRARLQHWARANPLLVLALAGVAGILMMEAGWLPWAHGGSSILAGVAAVMLLHVLRAGHTWTLLPGCVLAFAFLHGVRLDETFRHPLRTHLEAVAATAQTHAQHRPPHAVVRGTLLPEFDFKSEDRAFALCKMQDLRLSSPADGSSASFTQPGTLLVRLPPGVKFPGAGTYELRGRLLLPHKPGNPGEYDGSTHALRQGRVGRLEVDTLRRVTAASPASVASLECHLLQSAEDCRQWIGAQLSRDLDADPQTAAVIRAMALGVSAEADEEIEDAFRDSGTLHVFAVSGLHVALLGLIAQALLRQLRTPRRLALLLMITAVFAYAFITGWRPSAARAAFMVAVFLGATLADRTSSLQNSLGAAALILLGFDSNVLFMPGFQLSFGVLWASALGSAPLLHRLRPLTQLDPFLPPQLANARQRASAWCRRWLVTTLSVSLAAWVGSLPFILVHFQAITPVAVFANCVLVPLSYFCLGATCLSLCAAVAHLSGAQLLFNNLNWCLAKAMIVSATWFSHLPGASFHFEPERPMAVKHAPASWRMLRLPHGGAAHQLKIGADHWLLDVGDAFTFRQILRPALRKGGVSDLQGVILSHNDADHIGGLTQLSAFLSRPPPLYTTEVELAAPDSKRSTLRRYLEAHPETIPQVLNAGKSLPLSQEGAAFRVEARLLYPTEKPASGAADDRAMVLMLHLGPWRVLWMSDAGWDTEKTLCSNAAAKAGLRCDVLIRSQHEVDLSLSEEFLLAASPQVILCGSDDRLEATRLPAALSVFAQRHSIPLFDTWLDGSIDLRMDDTTLQVLPLHTRQAPVVLKHGRVE